MLNIILQQMICIDNIVRFISLSIGNLKSLVTFFFLYYISRQKIQFFSFHILSSDSKFDIFVGKFLDLANLVFN